MIATVMIARYEELRFRSLLQRLADRTDAYSGMAGARDHPDGTVPAPASEDVDALIGRIDLLGHRLQRRHAVTGLPTRETLLETIDDQSSDGSESGLLGLVELSDFDRLAAFDGKAADYLLKSVSSRIVRMVGRDRILAQIDRARFAIWFKGPSLLESQNEFEAVCYALRDRVVGPGIDILPQIASGSVARNEDETDAAALLARAINALRSTANAPLIAAQDSIKIERHNFVFEQDLRQAIHRNQLHLLYQPFVDAESARVCGAEALLRWTHETEGLISPATFMPVAEAIGLAQDIGIWVLNAACGQAAKWHRDGLSKIKVAVNLSAHQLDRGDLDVVVNRILQRYSLPPAFLELELTETVAAADSSGAKLLFDKIRAHGVSISIDDFGAGYSSLGSLKKLTFDKIKIDREFVTDVESRRDSQAICQSIIALGRGLGISVLAEGVERWDEYEWLFRHGCKLFQGYYFSRPVSATGFTEFASNHARIAALAQLGPEALQRRVSASI